MHYFSAYNTDIGIRRKTNQDSLVIRHASTDKGETIMAVVCDGMGGLAEGELASKEMALRFASWFSDVLPDYIYSELNMELLKKDWGRIIIDQDDIMSIYAEKKGYILGTTVTALLLFDDHYYIVHVGDTRCYQFFEDSVKQITEDDSLVESELRRGMITPEEAETDPRRNILTNCVGGERGVIPGFYDGVIGASIGFLLCTDGFWHRNSPEKLNEISASLLAGDAENLQRTLAERTEYVKKNKEKDNITAVAVGIKGNKICSGM